MEYSPANQPVYSDQNLSELLLKYLVAMFNFIMFTEMNIVIHLRGVGWTEGPPLPSTSPFLSLSIPFLPPLKLVCPHTLKSIFPKYFLLWYPLTVKYMYTQHALYNEFTVTVKWFSFSIVLKYIMNVLDILNYVYSESSTL